MKKYLNSMFTYNFLYLGISFKVNDPPDSLTFQHTETSTQCNLLIVETGNPWNIQIVAGAMDVKKLDIVIGIPYLTYSSLRSIDKK